MIQRNRQHGAVNVFHVFAILAVVLLAGGAHKWYQGYQKRAELQRVEEARKADRLKAEELRTKLDADKSKILSVLRKWDDALGLANMTSRIALAQPVSQMQAVRREMQDLKTNSCFDAATKVMVDAMNDALFAFEMFAKYPNNSSTSTYLEKMSQGFATANRQIAQCYPPTASASSSSAPELGMK